MSTTIKPRTATIPIYQGDDLERLAELRRAVDEAERQAIASEGAPRRGGDEIPTAQAAKDAYNAFVDEAAERAVGVVVEALGRRKFRDLMAEHPPREGNDDDAVYDVNVDTFPYEFLPPSITEPSMTPHGCESFLDSLAEGDFERLFAAAYWLNRGPGHDPKDSRYSAEPQTSRST